MSVGDAADPIRNSLYEREYSMRGPLSLHRRKKLKSYEIR